MLNFFHKMIQEDEIKVKIKKEKQITLKVVNLQNYVIPICVYKYMTFLYMFK